MSFRRSMPLIAGALFLWLQGCVAPLPPAGPTANGNPTAALASGGERHRITLLHTNDIHAGFQAEPATWREDKAPVGGFEMLSATVSRIRSEQPYTLVFDAGDVLSGHPISQVPVDGIKGFALFDLMNQVGYDAWTPGNHDFDNGQETLARIIPRLKFQTVVCNLERAGQPSFHKNVVPSTILSAGPVKVGVIGVMTTELPRLVSKAEIEGVTVVPPAEAVRAQVRALDPKTDLLVVLSHEGETFDAELAKAVPEIDVIIGGHSHKRINPPMQVGRTLIVQAGSNLQNLGRLDLEVADDQVVGHSAELIPLLVTPEAKATPAVAEAMTRARALLDTELSQVVGELRIPWQRQYHAESNAGDWITDQLRARAGAEVAFLNSGGIRKDLPAGPVTRGDLLSVLPFNNQLCTFRLTGEEMRRVVEADINAALEKSRGSLQVSGLRYKWRREGTKAVVFDLTVNGTSVEPTRSYLAATSDFLLFSQPDKYFPGVKAVEAKSLGLPLSQVVIEGMERARVVEMPLEGRIVEAPAGP